MIFYDFATLFYFPAAHQAKVSGIVDKKCKTTIMGRILWI